MEEIKSVYSSCSLIKPVPYEAYDYKVIELKNNMKICYISSPELNMSACCIGMGVGSYEDEKAYQGLAHFCEHMLFLGNDKHPEDNAYEEFVANHGGMNNAYTAFNETIYYATIDSNHIVELTERMTEFFISPKFNEDCVEREIKAIQSEFELNYNRDELRIDNLFRRLLDNRHPISNFTCGNLESLLDSVDVHALRDKLLEYRKNYFSANIMSAVIIGPTPVDEIMEATLPLFGKILCNPDVSVVRDTVPSDLQQHILCKIVPVKPDDQKLVLRIVIDDTMTSWRTKPSYYIEQVIGYEGKGSILSTLKKLGWASSVVVYDTYEGLGFSVIVVSVDVTDSGLDKYEEIIQLIYRALSELRSKLDARLVEDLQLLNNIQWKFKGMSSLDDIVTRVTHNLLAYPIEECLAGGEYIHETSVRHIEKMLTSILDKPCLSVALISTKFADETDLEERWYNTKYAMSELDLSILDADKLESTHKTLIAAGDECALYQENKYIPRDTTIETNKRMDYPIKVDTPFKSLSLYYNASEYNIPKTEVSLLFYSKYLFPQPMEGAIKNSLLSKPWLERYAIIFVYLNYLKEVMNEELYDAIVVGSKINLTLTNGGGSGPVAIEFNVDCFTCILSSIMEFCFEHMARCEIRVETMGLTIQTLRTNLSNSINNMKPYQQGFDLMSQMHNAAHISIADVYEYILSLTTEDMIGYHEELCESVMANNNATGLITSNAPCDKILQRIFDPSICWSKLLTRDVTLFEDAISYNYPLADHSMLAFSRCLTEVPRVASPTDKIDVYLVINKPVLVSEESKAIVISAKAKDDNIETAANVLVLENWLYDTFFTSLRTRQGLGYVCSALTRHVSGVPLICFVLQSPYEGGFLFERIFDFYVDKLNRGLPGVTESQFTSLKDALIAKLREPAKDTSELHHRYMVELYNGRLDFSRRQRLVDILTTLKFTEFNTRMDRLWGSNLPWSAVVIDQEDFKLPSDTDYGLEKLVNITQLKHVHGPK